MIWATPALPLPAWVSPGQLTVSPASRVQSAPPDDFRNLVKLLVVPEPSERWATTIAVLGRVTPGLSAAMAASFHVLTVRLMILASVGPLSWSLSTPLRL